MAPSNIFILALLLALQTAVDAAGAFGTCDPSCLSCNKFGQCTACKAGQGIKKGKCEWCKDQLCWDCQSDIAACRKCNPDAYLSPAGCKPLQRVNGCEAYDRNGKCSRCLKGYVKIGTACYGCQQYVNWQYAELNLHCAEANCTGVCRQCEAGYGKVRTKCEQCKVDWCAKCDGDVSQCTECRQGYRLEDGKCVECQCYHASTCSPGPDGYDICQGPCEDGWVGEWPSCGTCHQACSWCHKNGTCGECLEGYAMDSTAACVPGKVAHCQIYDNNRWKCKECELGWTVSPKKQCRQCTKDPNCVECDASGCTSCSNGFGAVKGKCVKCVDNRHLSPDSRNYWKCASCDGNVKMCKECDNQLENGDYYVDPKSGSCIRFGFY